ncbi:hypothetical protein [Tsukamurella spumae]|uniref:Uncharacterized protein n=1 Tax=Tsukamurella spumae TaxID=44753 RepID=A0A846X5U5_9ACTN|nr:hypothetical protein [Tsukamurella spumae]NKY20814.1 hypothetical protein [Tsukamurella spumae]
MTKAEVFVRQGGDGGRGAAAGCRMRWIGREGDLDDVVDLRDYNHLDGRARVDARPTRRARRPPVGALD